MKIKYRDREMKEQIVEQDEYTQSIAHEMIKQYKYIYLHTRSDNYILLKEKVFLPHPCVFRFIHIVNDYLSQKPEYESVVDVGTGSGVIICEIAKKYPNKKLMCTDVSRESEHISKENIAKNAQNIVFYKSKPEVWIPAQCKKIDVVVSNPPYVVQSEMQKNEFANDYPDYVYQPKTALLTHDKSGLSPYMHILRDGLAIGAKTFIFECNSSTIDEVKKMIIKNFGLTIIQYRKDSLLSFLVAEKTKTK